MEWGWNSDGGHGEAVQADTVSVVASPQRGCWPLAEPRRPLLAHSQPHQPLLEIVGRQ
ncbi:uncharacterized protein J3R85_017659 [Psidium guajava]|nr:uncharacterized protein J3R85_017659 [Psidium guajava]